MRSKKRVLIGVYWALLLLMLAVPAMAAVIAVDGDNADWSTIGNLVDDADESGIPNDWDVDTIQFTHDTTNLYWNIETFDNHNVNSAVRIYICLNTDNDTGTGSAVSQCEGNVGQSMQGVDYVLQSTSVPVFAFYLYSCTDGGTSIGDCSTFVSTAVTTSAKNGTVIEVGQRGSDVGIDPLSCTTSAPCPIPMAAYFDNGDSPDDDNIPDSGSVVPDVDCDVNCSPSAISLGGFEVAGNSSVMPLGVVAVLMLSVFGTGVVIYGRRQRE